MFIAIPRGVWPEVNETIGSHHQLLFTWLRSLPVKSFYIYYMTKSNKQRMSQIETRKFTSGTYKKTFCLFAALSSSWHWEKLLYVQVLLFLLAKSNIFSEDSKPACIASLVFTSASSVIGLFSYIMAVVIVINVIIWSKVDAFILCCWFGQFWWPGNPSGFP